MVLTITNNEVLNLCRLDTTDATNTADVTEVISKGQDGYEAMLQSDALNDPLLTAFLRRNVAKLLAADLLAIRAREDGAAVGLQGAGLTLGPPPDFAGKLRSEAMATLLPYLRASRLAPAITTPDTSSASHSAQEQLFGATEYERSGG